MKFYGIEMRGQLNLEKLSDLPSFNAERDEGRIIYSLLDNRLYLGTNDRGIYLSGIEIVETLPGGASTDEGRVVYLTEDEYLYYGDSSDGRRILTTTDLEDGLSGHIGVGGTSQHPVATVSVAGFMSAADKEDLDGHIGVGGVEHPVATPSVAGFMSAADKEDLDGHIGVGGTDQHPVAWGEVAGFMSAVDKSVFDNLGNIYLIKAGDTITGIVNITPPIGGTSVQFYTTFRLRQSVIADSAPVPADGNNGDVGYQYI